MLAQSATARTKRQQTNSSSVLLMLLVSARTAGRMNCALECVVAKIYPGNLSFVLLLVLVCVSQQTVLWRIGLALKFVVPSCDFLRL